MKAVQLVGVRRALELREVSAREPGPGEIRVRVRAAGICHSDAHYRAGLSPLGPLPLTLGHEIAGVVERTDPGLRAPRTGDRVCLHYLLACGRCAYCAADREAFCAETRMLGHHVDGGFAEAITVPARNAIPLPAAIPFEQGAILMCSSATALHALRQGRLRPGETVAVFGSGGLGYSAVQLARALGAKTVFAVDIRADKLAVAERLGAVPVDAGGGDPVARLRAATAGAGVDVALELVGIPATMRQALTSLAPRGRAVLVALSDQRLELDPYRELLGREAELIGSNDHTLGELAELIDFCTRGELDLAGAIARTVPLEAAAIDDVLDQLDRARAGVRTVIVP